LTWHFTLPIRTTRIRISEADDIQMKIMNDPDRAAQLLVQFVPCENMWGTKWQRITGIQGVAFSTMVDSNGVNRMAASLNNEASETSLLSVLAMNPVTKKYYESVNLPTETLNVVFNDLNTVGLFVDGTAGNDDSTQVIGTVNNSDFEEHGILFSDQAVNWAGTAAYTANAITAQATFTSSTANHSTVISNLSIFGDGAAIDSAIGVQNITSTGALGDVLLRGNAPMALVAANLNGVTAPAIFGNVDLVGGTLATRGIRTDAVSGATSTIAAYIGSDPERLGDISACELAGRRDDCEPWESGQHGFRWTGRCWVRWRGILA
jgi:hypothetical protein